VGSAEQPAEVSRIRHPYPPSDFANRHLRPGQQAAGFGLAARRMMRSPHVAGNLGDSIPGLLRTAGFDCAEVAAQRRRIIGRVTFYRATRPA
jgi:hypothetical protein